MNVSYIIFEDGITAERKIIRTGSSPKSLVQAQAGHGEVAVEGKADDAIHKIDMSSGKPVVVNKTQAEIDADKPPVILPDAQAAHITKKDYDSIIARLDKLEKP